MSPSAPVQIPHIQLPHDKASSLSGALVSISTLQNFFTRFVGVGRDLHFPFPVCGLQLWKLFPYLYISIKVHVTVVSVDTGTMAARVNYNNYPCIKKCCMVVIVNCSFVCVLQGTQRSTSGNELQIFFQGIRSQLSESMTGIIANLEEKEVGIVRLAMY